MAERIIKFDQANQINESEKEIIKQLKSLQTPSFTAKMEGMIKDLVQSEDIFQESLEKTLYPI